MNDNFEFWKAVSAPALALFSAGIGYFFARSGGNDIRVVGPPSSGKAHRAPTLVGRDSEEDLKSRVRENSLFDGSGSELDLKLKVAREEHSDVVEWMECRGDDRTCGVRSAKISLDLTLANVGDRPGVLGSIGVENRGRFDKDIIPSIHVEGLPITLRENETRILSTELHLIVEPDPRCSFDENLMRRNKLVDLLATSPVRVDISLEVVSLRRVLRSQAKYKKVSQKILLDYAVIDKDSFVNLVSLKSFLKKIELLDIAERRAASKHFNRDGRLFKEFEEALGQFGNESSNARKIVEGIIDFLKNEEIMYWPTERGFGVCGPASLDVVDIIANDSESIYLEAEAFKYRELSELSEFKERLLFDEKAEHRTTVEIRSDTIELAKDIIAHMVRIMSYPELRKDLF